VRITELAHVIDARLVVPCGKADAQIRRVFGGQAMSDLIANASVETLLITSLNNCQLIRMAELMDVPGICLVDAKEPTPDLIDLARSAGTALLVSRADLINTCARAAGCVSAEKAART